MITSINDTSIPCTGNQEVVGVILYGSHSIGRADNLSDMDIAIIIDNARESYEYIESEEYDLDIAYIPIQRLEEVLEETPNRSNHSLWLTHSLYLKILVTGKILYDPYGLIKKYKNIVKHWRWMEKDIENARDHLREIINYAIRLYEDSKTLETTILLVDAINTYMIIKEMMNNNIPSPQPKDLFKTAKNYGLLNQYITVHRLRHISINTITETIKYLKDDRVPYMRRNLKSIIRLLERGEKAKALLTARKAFLGILDSRLRNSQNLYDPQLKIKILENIDAKQRSLLEKLYNIQQYGTPL